MATMWPRERQRSQTKPAERAAAAATAHDRRDAPAARLSVRARWPRVGALGALGGALLVATAAVSLATLDDGRVGVLGAEPEARAAETTEPEATPTETPQPETTATETPEPEATATATPITRPPLIRRLVPFGAKRKRQTAAYGKRHYGSYSHRLRPKTIILHYTAGGTWRTAWNYFAANRRDAEFGELPGPVTHFIIGKDGKIYHLLGTLYRGRHCVGLNHRAIGIEFVQDAGSGGHWASRQILNRKKQVEAGLKLVRWLQKKYHIKTTLVYGHAFASKHPMFKDLSGWRNTHGDWPLKETKIFRERLKALD